MIPTSDGPRAGSVQCAPSCASPRRRNGEKRNPAETVEDAHAAASSVCELIVSLSSLIPAESATCGKACGAKPLHTPNCKYVSANSKKPCNTMSSCSPNCPFTEKVDAAPVQRIGDRAHMLLGHFWKHWRGHVEGDTASGLLVRRLVVLREKVLHPDEDTSTSRGRQRKRTASFSSSRSLPRACGEHPQLQADDRGHGKARKRRLYRRLHRPHFLNQ